MLQHGDREAIGKVRDKLAQVLKEAQNEITVFNANGFAFLGEMETALLVAYVRATKPENKDKDF